MLPTKLVVDPPKNNAIITPLPSRKKKRQSSSALLTLLALGMIYWLLQQWITSVEHDRQTTFQSYSDLDSFLVQKQPPLPVHDVNQSSSPPPTVFGPIIRNDHDSSFSACLLVMDDNAMLTEWLAYHYHTLPLRYLVIAVDPRSRTSPTEILSRYQQMNMTIVQWNDAHFLPPHWLHRIPAEDDPIALFQKHRERQRHFYPACLEYLQKHQRDWTVIVDVDEFVAQNVHWSGRQQVSTKERDSDAPIPTLLDSIHTLTKDDKQPFDNNTVCISMPRLRFGTFENATTTTNSNIQNSLRTAQDRLGLSPKDFATLRWTWRAGLHSRGDNKHPKCMLSLQRITSNKGDVFSRENTDAHRPVRSECPRRNLYVLNRDSPWTVHHYVGSLEQFQFRKDARDQTATRGRDRLQEYQNLNTAHDDSMGWWFTYFVGQVGVDQAKMLLQGVGNVSFSAVRAVDLEPP